MGITERRQRERDALKQKVLGAAEELFAENGVENVSMRKIAEKIEYSPTTIYRLFESKEDLMQHLIEDGYVRVYQRYQEIIDARPVSPFESLSQIIRTYVEFALENPQHYELWFSTSELTLIDEVLHMRHGEAVYKVYGTWLEKIEEAKAAGQMIPAETLALFQLIWGSVHGLIALRSHHPDFPWSPLQEHIEDLLQMLNRGLAPANEEPAT